MCGVRHSVTCVSWGVLHMGHESGAKRNVTQELVSDLGCVVASEVSYLRQENLGRCPWGCINGRNGVCGNIWECS